MKISRKGLSGSIRKWCCITVLKEKAKLKRCASYRLHQTKIWELCLLSAYRNLLDEQSSVLREITASSPETFPDVASETLDLYAWEELLTQKNNTSCLCKKHAQRCMLLRRSKSTEVLIANYSPPLRQPGSDFWCSSGTKPPFSLVLEFQKTADLKSLPCLLTAQLLTRGASRLKLANQRVRCVTFHCIICDREQDKAQYSQALTPTLLAALPSAQQSSLPPAEVKPKRRQRTCEGLSRQKKKFCRAMQNTHASSTREKKLLNEMITSLLPAAAYRAVLL